MKLAVVISLLASFGVLALGAAAILEGQSNLHLPKPTISRRNNIEGSHALSKRDAYTCYSGNINATVGDCQAAINKVESHGLNQTFSLYGDTCLNWAAGACAVRFCAQPYVIRTVNRTAQWLVNYLNSPLLDCVKGGQFGIMSDHPNINSNAGTYRLHLELPR
ncbi:hypothetical protein F5Y15DRAFT_215587 [Xylariaceae sp. FL0016]|nr:hypothetical protein F5Y15DRAFT_215587 [Xylariaceae sp. FL0016]